MDTRKVLVTGGSKLPIEFCAVVKEIGRSIMLETDFQMITGGLKEAVPGVPTTDHEAVQGALLGLQQRGGDPIGRILTMIPQSDPVQLKRFYHGTVIHVQRSNTRARRYSMVLSSDAVIAIAGEKGTPEVIDLAWVAGKPVIVIAGAGEAARVRWDRYKLDFVPRLGLRVEDEEIRVLEATPPDPVRTAQVCVKILRKILRPRCFIAMRIGDHPLPNCFETIRAEAEVKGFVPIRVDQETFTGSIVEAIWSAIRECEIVIADLTGGNLNVFYELGISHAFGKRTLLTVYDTHARVPDYIPFDVRHHLILPYGSVESLMAQLRNHLPKA